MRSKGGQMQARRGLTHPGTEGKGLGLKGEPGGKPRRPKERNNSFKKPRLTKTEA